MDEESHIKCEFLRERKHYVILCMIILAKKKDGSKKIEESEFQVYQRWNGHDGGNYRKEMLDMK